MDDSPLLSVIMSVRNGMPYLGDAIQSILRQTYPHFEFLILNDASTDDTAEVLQYFAGQDQRIRVIHHTETQGLTKSLNQLLGDVNGDFVARQDADDLSTPDRFDRQLQLLEHDHHAVAVGCRYEVIDTDGNAQRLSNGQVVGASPALLRWLYCFDNWIGGHSGLMFHRQALVDRGGYNEEYPTSQDYELLVRLVDEGVVRVMPEVLLLLREHGASVSATQGEANRTRSLQIARDAIHQWCGETVSEEAMAGLRRFWQGGGLPSGSVRQFDQFLRTLYQGFLKDNQARPPEQQLGDPERLHVWISARYVQAALATPFWQRPVTKMRLLRTAERWHPGPVKFYWKRRPATFFPHVETPASVG